MPSRLSVARPPALGLAAALVAAAFVPLLGSPAPAAAATPLDVIFEEGFENTGATPILLDRYTGANGTTYVADAGWLTGCNGNILAGNSPADVDITKPSTNCTAKSDTANATAFAKLRQLAMVLGEHAQMPDPVTNHVLAAFTDGPNPGVGRQLQSSDVALGASSEGRYLGLSIDGAAMSCSSGSPNYEFSIMNPIGGAVTGLGSASLCSDPSRKTVTAAAIPSAGAIGVVVATVESTQAVKYTGTSLRAIIRNTNGSGSGNDAAVDNMRILDMTPTLTKAFATTSNTVGDNATLVFTVTNSPDLLAKPGWSFTDNLPAGMTVVNPVLTTTCTFAPGKPHTVPMVSTTAVAGSGSFAIAGDLPANADSCSISMTVTAGSGDYSNGADNITSTFLKSTEIAAATASWGVPTDAPEAKVTPINTAVELDPFENFTAVAGDPSQTTPNAASFRFGNGQTSMSTTEGEWSHNATTRRVTFTPARDYTGVTPNMPYTYADSNGNSVASHATVTVGGKVVDLANSGDQGQPVTVDLAGETADIDPTSVRLIDPSTGLAADGDVTVAGEGRWSVDPTTGAMTFTPEASFTGNPTPIDYTATDGTGAEVTAATVTVTYPDVSDVAGTGDEGQPVTVAVDLGVGVLATTVQLIDPGTGAPTRSSVVVAGEGEWSVDATTGAVTFTPEPGFDANPTPIQYVADNAAGDRALAATVTISYPGVSDVAQGGDQGKPVTVPTDLGIGVDPTTVQLIDPATGSPTSTPVVVDGEGTWSVDVTTGAVTFTPEEGFGENPTPIAYTARNADGNVALPAFVTVTYPNVADVARSGTHGSPVTVPADLAPGVDATTVTLIDPATGDPRAGNLVVRGEGVWSVNPVTGDITFTPEVGFEGNPTPITYTAQDGSGSWATPATVTITYEAAAGDGGVTPTPSPAPSPDPYGPDEPANPADPDATPNVPEDPTAPESETDASDTGSTDEDSADAGTSPNGEALPATGLTVSPLAGSIMALLLAAGAMLVLVGRRRASRR